MLPMRGSSPRERGTLVFRGAMLIAIRFIPARAGNAVAQPAVAVLPPVHPRASGERSGRTRAVEPLAGSSPRERGTPPTLSSVSGCQRFIPARAGNARSLAPRSRTTPVHPRASGERVTGWPGSGKSTGSSPRERGTRRSPRGGGFRRRFIPARAGNASNAAVAATSVSVHPRASGERDWTMMPRPIRLGSSPRERGTRPWTPPATYPARFIPARAGNATTAPTPTRRSPVHPRASGERGEIFPSLDLNAGSSPRERGTRSRR